MRTLAFVALFFAVIASTAHAQTVLQPDAAPPGASVVVSLIAANGGWTGSEVITTSCPSKIIVGPKWLSAGAGNPASPINNAVLSTVFFVLENAAPGNCNVLVNNVALTATGAIDNIFSVVLPREAPVDGGPDDETPANDNIIRIRSAARSDGGVVVFSSLNIPAGKKLEFSKVDPVTTTGGNEAYMPIIVLVRGDAVVNGTIDASGESGKNFGDNRLARSKSGQSSLDGGDGGHGGPGGGGGAAGGPHNATASGTGGYAGTGGDGFGGGSGSPSVVFDKAPGGAGVAFPPSDVAGGNSPFNRGGGLPSNYVTSGGGGGSGNPFGIGGQGAQETGGGGASGYGGGGGSNTNNSTSAGGAGGGFATSGLPGGGGGSDGGKAGLANGLPSLVPMMGGSGGGGGDGWITSTGPNQGNFGGGGGGGGGGALELVVYGTLSGNGSVLAKGGIGGNAGNGNSASSGGGGGSGGGIFLAARSMTFTGTVDVRGGAGGVNPPSTNPGGAGGEGRVRYDGKALPTLTNGPTGTAGTTWQGCAVTSVNTVVITTVSSTQCAYTIINSANTVVGSGTINANASLDTTAQFNQHGDLTVVFSRDNVPSPVGIARVIADTDKDTIPDFADADDDDDGIPDLLETAAGLLDLDSDDDGIPDVIEAYGPGYDINRDGRPDVRIDSDFDGLVDQFDAAPGNGTIFTAALTPRSTDGDGTADFRDLDSDGDGYFDLIEAGGVESDNNGVIDSPVDADRDGLLGFVDPSEGGVPWALTDSDGNGVDDRIQVCGDKRLSSGEICDLGAGNGTDCRCSLTCQLPGAAVSCTDGDFCSNADHCDGGGACVGGGLTCNGSTPLCDRDNSRCLACIFRPGIIDACDGIDVDCDGATDEDFAAAATTCGLGRCAGTIGATHCDGMEGVRDDCDPLGAATTETCNALDDDCDGTADDGAGCPALETAITSAPPEVAASANASFVFTNPLVPGFTTFDCSLDGAAWTACGATLGLTVADGSHTLLVRARGPNGAVDPTPAFHSWRVDAEVPDTHIVLAPDAVTSSPDALFAFTGGVLYECALDGDDWAPCDAFEAFLGLDDGEHTLDVRAISESGLVDPTPAEHEWLIDTRVPDTIITSGPFLTAETIATFTFTGTSAASFECRTDDGAWVVCVSPFTISGLAVGPHLLAVSAVSPSGVVDPTPATWPWTVETAAPQTTIVVGPAPIVVNLQAAFVFTGGVTYQCMLDTGAWQPCAASATFTVAAGAHTLAVRAYSATGVVDPTPATWTWTADPSVPDTTITSGPSLTAATTATFTFTGVNAASFECRTDSGAWAVCVSPFTITGLSAGPHLFAVRAIGVNSVVDPTPATWQWTIATAAPDTSIVIGPAPIVVELAAAFVFTGGVTYECMLDTGAWQACAASATFTVTAGAHTLNVRAYSATGVVDPTPATWSWTADPRVPDTTITSGPSLTAATTATFTFTGVNAASFECRTNSGEWAVCVSPFTVNGLSAGPHLLAVRGVGSNGVVDPTPATWQWAISTAAPGTSIVVGPAPIVVELAAAFVFTGGVTYECMLDTGAWQACAASATFTVTAGAHTLNVRAYSATGVVDPTPATWTWTADPSVPDTTITSGPSLTAATTATFTFTGVNAASFECRTDSGAWAVCVSPFTINGLSAGPHLLAVRGVGSNGVVDPTPATWQWSVSTAAPDTAIVLGPDPLVSELDALFVFTGGATYECMLDGDDWAPCAATTTFTVTAGDHTLDVRAYSAASVVDPTPASWEWTADPSLPETVIHTGPIALSAATTAAFTFSDPNTPSRTSFECRVDSGAWSPCSLALTIGGLTSGLHLFSVRAVGDTGLVDPTPATWSWTIDAAAPDTTIVIGPDPLVTELDALFVFEGGVSYECMLDDGDWQPCDATVVFDVAPGDHLLTVRALSAAGLVDETPATWTWTVDPSVPETALTSAPPLLTASTSATFTFVDPSMPARVTFECRLDSFDWADCESPFTISELFSGPHQLSVRAVGDNGVVDPTPVIHGWTIAPDAPDTLITLGPAALTTATTATFAFSGGVTYECALDGADWAPCAALVTFAALADGEHDLAVRALSATGVVDATPATWTWTVDTTTPDTAITAAPDALTGGTDATFTFVDPTAPARTTFECRLDGAAWSACSSPLLIAALGAGSHTLLVRALGANGVVDPTPAFHVWTVDTSIPETTILLGPGDPSQSGAAAFAFGGGVTYECALDADEPIVWAPCAAVTTYAGLTDGAHELLVRARNAAGAVDPTPATWPWTIDSTRPETTVTSGPPPLTDAAAATITFTSDAEAFLCRLDDGAWSDCDGTVSYTGLSDGPHRFEVAAVDDGGNVDPTPAIHSWVVDRTVPDTFIVSAPDAVTQSDLARFVLDASEAATFECMLDAGAWEDCTTIVNVDSLTPGAHVFSARATDLAGNVDATPATHGWTVDLTAPETAITGTPEGPLASDETATFDYQDPVSPARTTFQCRVDQASWVSCDGGQYDVDVGVGVHVFAVRACDDVCDPSPATAIFEVSASSCPRDTSAPVITCAADVHHACGTPLDPATFLATATDDCGATVTVAGPEVVVLGEPALFVYVATDGNGNVASCLTRAYIEDEVAPTITCPEAASVLAGATCDAVFAPFPSPQASDGCDAAPTISGNAPARFALGTTVVTYVARDASGNQASCTMDVTVVDEVLPTITCADVTHDAAADACGWQGEVDAELVDNCMEGGVLDETKDFPVGTTTVTFSSAGASCVADVVVRDVTPPTVTCDAAPEDGAAAALMGGQADDACGVTLTIEDACDGCEVRGAAVYAEAQNIERTVSYTLVATDPSGNVGRASCSAVLGAAIVTEPTIVTAQGSGGCEGAGSAPGLIGLVLAIWLGRRRFSRNCVITGG